MEFRRKALQNLRAPDEVDAPVRLARPRAWAVLVVLALLTASGAVWAVRGNLDRTVSAPGLLSHPLGVSRVQSPEAGTVTDVFTKTAALVPKGTPLLGLSGRGGTEATVRAPFTGRVIALQVSGGEYVPSGGDILTMERTDGGNDRLTASLFAPASAAGLMRVGDRADLAVSSASSAAFGLLRGRVTAIDQYPMSEQQVADFLGGNRRLADRLLKDGGPVHITVALDGDAKTASGYRWTTEKGPPFRVESQAQVTGYARLAGEHPIDWLLPS